MLLDLHDRLRGAGLRISLNEWLTMLGGLSRNVGTLSLDHFYRFARLSLIKDESQYDRYDQVFKDYWAGREQRFDTFSDAMQTQLPEDWLTLADRPELSEEQKAAVEALGGWDTLMETLAERLKEQTGEHHGGNRWIGTGGTSPFGHSGFNPEGIRIGSPDENARRQGRGVKVWEQRRYRDLDGSREMGTRHFKMALRKLRRLAREGREDSLDLDDTIRSTASNAGLLDIKLRADRRNAMKVLLLIDIGGSMDPHARVCEQLFSAARTEFRRLDVYYFHNFLYESVWTDNQRRHNVRTGTAELIRTLGRDHRLIIVGDATMSPYEIVVPGGSVEHWNEEPGALWLRRLQQAFAHCVWLNPEDPQWWQRTPSVRMTQELMHDRMHPLSLDGLEAAIQTLKTPLRLN